MKIIAIRSDLVHELAGFVLVVFIGMRYFDSEVLLQM